MNRLFITLLLIVSFILISQPCLAITKCYKDICVGQIVIVNSGLYKGNKVMILDIIKEGTQDEEQIRDYYKYFVSFEDGIIAELYRDELTIRGN